MTQRKAKNQALGNEMVLLTTYMHLLSVMPKSEAPESQETKTAKKKQLAEMMEIEEKNKFYSKKKKNPPLPKQTPHFSHPPHIGTRRSHKR